MNFSFFQMEEQSIKDSNDTVIINENNINYEINTKDGNARVINSPDAKGKIIIPASINYQSNDYFITSISRNSFKKNQKIETVSFQEPSKISSFQANAFKLSSIKQIFIPSTLTELCDGWCNKTHNLNSITISPNNKNFIFFNNQCILGKLQPTSGFYDSMIFVRRDIIDIAIPSFVKVIRPYCFQNCSYLKNVFFGNDSLLTLIGKYAFAQSSIETINIPINVNTIGEYAFFECNNLKSRDILQKTQYIEVGKNAFTGTFIEKEMEPDVKSTDQISFENSIYENMKALLDKKEKEQLDEISSHFSQINHFTNQTYYSLIEALSNFGREKECKWNIERSFMSGIVNSFLNFEYNGNSGSVILINPEQVGNIIKKSRSTFTNSFLKKYAFELNIDELKDIFDKKRKILVMMIAHYDIMQKLGCKCNFYFVKKPPSINFKFELKVFNPLPNEKLPNNFHFLETWQDNKRIQNMLKRWKDYLIQFNNIMLIMKYKFDDENTVYCYDDVDLNKLSNDDASKFSFLLLDKMKELIHTAILKYLNHKNNFVNDVIQKLCDGDQEKVKIYSEIFNSILNHQKYKSWNNSKALEFSFLIKYCSSSAYYRLYELLDEKLPSPQTIESAYRNQVIDRENLLLNAERVNDLLNRYLIDTKDRINDLLREFNKKFKTNIKFDEFKIEICLSSDAASLTPFTNKKKDNEKEETEENNHHKPEKEIIFENLVKGGLDRDPNFIQAMKIREEVTDENAKHFFTMLLQPFMWDLPLTVVHLSKSINGHFSLNEIEDIMILAQIINSHPNFSMHYFAADGDDSLNKFHEVAFDVYKKHIQKVINGEMTLKEFLFFIKSNCQIFPILDLYHGVKAGRNRTINNVLKLGENEDFISAEILKETLGINDPTLNDKSSLGRMKDEYAIHLFRMNNALKEFSKKHNSAGLYLLVFTLILEIFRNIYLEVEFRIDLSKLALYLLLQFYQSCDELPTETALKKNYKSQNKYVWFEDRIGLIKLINTQVAFTTILSDPKLRFHLGTERETSHPDESFFGQYRMHFIGNNQLKNAFRFAVRSSLAQDFQNDLDVQFQIPKKENVSGAHLSFRNKENEQFDIHSIPYEKCISDNIRQISCDLFEVGTGKKEKFDELTIIFLDSISVFFEKYQSKIEHEYSKVKGSDIVPRLINNK